MKFLGLKVQTNLHGTAKAAEESVQKANGAGNYRVVEVEKPSPARDLDQATKDSIVALRGNPGFEALLAKLKLQSAVLETRLKQNHHKSLEEVNFLQAGIFWLEFLQRTLEQETEIATNRPKPREPLEYEQEAFEKVRQALEIVGR